MLRILMLITVALTLFAACEKVEVRKKYFPSGKLMEEFEVTQDEYGQDVKSGVYRSFYESGKPHTECYYTDDKRHGTMKSWYQNGQIEYEEQYLFGKLSGKKKNYSLEGKLQIEVDYVDGKQHGLFVYYYPSGQKQHEIMKRNGINHGYHKRFDETGELDKVVYYDHGKMVDAMPDTSAVAATAAPSAAAPDTAVTQK